MRLFYLLIAAVLTPSAGAESAVEMTAVHVAPSQLYFRVRANDRDEIEKMEIISVETDSPAYRLGLRKGDLVTADDGAPIAGRVKSTICGTNGKIAFHGPITFEGHRGFLRKKWSLTIGLESLRKKTPGRLAEPIPSSPVGVP